MTSAVASALLAALIGAVGIAVSAKRLRRAPAKPPPAAQPSPYSPPAAQPSPYSPPAGPYGPPAGPWQQQPAGPRSPARRARSTGSRVPIAIAVAIVVVVIGAGVAFLVALTESGSDDLNPRQSALPTQTVEPTHTGPDTTSEPTSGPTEPTSAPGPTITVTVTAPGPLIGQQQGGGGGSDNATWIAALGAILAGLGTVASGVAAFVRPRRGEAD